MEAVVVFEKLPFQVLYCVLWCPEHAGQPNMVDHEPYVAPQILRHTLGSAHSTGGPLGDLRV